MCNAHESKIVFSPYSLKIHIKKYYISSQNPLLPQISHHSHPPIFPFKYSRFVKS
ncbi:hypothetical protein HanIR_Chr08g0350251 [Helianthus annuus]|nr:hypothetical protein HanIR_Chr08g0350251 [Helianthus annuus]